MDSLVLMLLWLAALSGGLAILGLMAEAVERFAEWMDGMFSHYVDD